MAENYYRVTTCDCCGKVEHLPVDLDADTTGWYGLRRLLAENDKGLPDMLEWDFCSFECLEKWCAEQHPKTGVRPVGGKHD